jgi:hypothetical protein
VQDAACDLDDDTIEVRFTSLERENAQLRRAARRNAFQGAEDLVAAGAEATRCEPPSLAGEDVGRRVTGFRHEASSVEATVLDGDAVEDAAADILRAYARGSVRQFARKPVLLSTAIARTSELYPSRDMI